QDAGFRSYARPPATHPPRRHVARTRRRATRPLAPHDGTGHRRATGHGRRGVAAAPACADNVPAGARRRHPRIPPHAMNATTLPAGDTAALLDLGRQYYLPIYRPRELVLERGQGSRLWDS